MRVIIEEGYDEISIWVAKYVKKRILEYNPTADRPFVLGLPTGSSPLGTYKELIKFHKSGELSFKHVVTFNMDEYVGLAVEHKQSYHSFMWTNFFQHVDVNPKNVFILNGNAPDLEKECESYEQEIKKKGGIELFLGGVGTDGHIAFNEPGSSLTSRTRVKTLAYETVIANARFFGGDIKKVPKMALTVGVGTVMDAREIVIIISGQSKAHALSKGVEEGVNHMCTLSALQLHPRSCIVCDEDATNELRVRTVKYFKGLAKVHDELLHYEGASNSSALAAMRKSMAIAAPRDAQAGAPPATPSATAGEKRAVNGQAGGPSKKAKA